MLIVTPGMTYKKITQIVYVVKEMTRELKWRTKKYLLSMKEGSTELN
jgi:hypothetical protein